jgi:hypothetical protein
MCLGVRSLPEFTQVTRVYEATQPLNEDVKAWEGSLLQEIINYGRKKSYKNGPRAQCYKTFLFVIY